MRELSLNVMDVVQNSISAEASLVTVTVEERAAEKIMDITIADDGRGMTAEQVEQVQSPFFTTRTTRPVGLGVPLFKMASEQTGGRFSIRSQPGEGTVVEARFHTGHIDMTPLGDMGETMVLLISCNLQLDFVYRHRVGEREFVLDTRQIKEILGGDVALNNPDVVNWMREYLREGEASLSGETAEQ